MNTYYIDWAHENIKKLAVCKNNDEVILEVDWAELNTIILPNDILYSETGCPKKQLIVLLKSGVQIFLVDSKKLHDLKNTNYLKTDTNDALFLRYAILNNKIEVIDFNLLSISLLPLKIIENNYSLLEKTSVRGQLNLLALEREYPNENIKDQLRDLKMSLKAINFQRDLMGQKMDKYFSLYKEFLNIRGIGFRLIGRILITATPFLFSNVRKYLKYCGYIGKNGSKSDQVYNRQAKSLFYQCTGQMLLQENQVYEPIYRSMRENYLNSDAFKLKHEKFNEQRRSKGWKDLSFDGYANACARNKISTLLCKEIYFKFKDFDITKKSETSLLLGKAIDKQNGIESFF